VVSEDLHVEEHERNIVHSAGISWEWTHVPGVSQG